MRLHGPVPVPDLLWPYSCGGCLRSSGRISCVTEALGSVQGREFYESCTVARGKPSLVLGKDWSHDAAMAGHSTFADWPPAPPRATAIPPDTGMATQARLGAVQTFFRPLRCLAR